MARLIIVIILVVIVVAILWRRKQPPPPLVEIHPPDARDEGRPALRGGEKGQAIADLPAESGDSIPENEKDRY